MSLGVAVLLVKVNMGLIVPPAAGGAGAGLDLALIAGFVAILFMGPGKASLDYVLGLGRDRSVAAEVLFDRREDVATT